MRISQLYAEISRRNRFLAIVGLIHFCLFGTFLLLSLIDQRTILGINGWIKPMKFALSIGIYVWTIGWYFGHFGGRIARWIGFGIGTTMLVEILCIALQAARGTQSHFNNATGFDALVFQTMGLMILLNTLLVVVVTLFFSFRPPSLPPLYLAGIRTGLLVFLFASGVGGIMIRNDAHAVGIPDGGVGLPFVNWSTEGGDLRVAHFLGQHALQILPQTAFLAGRFLARPRLAFYGVSALWILITVALFWQAMEGVPLYRL